LLKYAGGNLRVYGKNIAKLINTNEDKVATAKSLFGILPSDATLEQAREEMLKRHECID
jgi:hypothetical protein